MGDVRDILGLGSSGGSGNDDALKFLDEKPKHSAKKAISKPKGMSRELFMLQGWSGIAPAVAATPSINTGFKDKRQSNSKGKWVWECRDGVFYHWTKAENVETEYPWAKFNVHMDRIDYTDNEYTILLATADWTREETDYLMDICYKFDLRWAVIYDRYQWSSSSANRRVEDLQGRFFDIIGKVRSYRANLGVPNMRADSTVTINVEYEKARRQLQETHFVRFKEEDGSLSKIKEEMKALTAGPKKKARSSKTAAKTDDKATAAAAAAVLANPTDPQAVLDTTSAMNMSLQPQEGKPCLQSTRLTIDAKATCTISKNLFGKMTAVLKELDFPEAPIPTRAAMDMMDNIRKNALGLVSLRTAIKAKEKKIEAQRIQLGTLVPDSKKIDVPSDSFVPVALAAESSIVEDFNPVVNTKRKSVAPPKKKKRSGGLDKEDGGAANKKVKLTSNMPVPPADFAGNSDLSMLF